MTDKNNLLSPAAPATAPAAAPSKLILDGEATEPQPAAAGIATAGAPAAAGAAAAGGAVVDVTLQNFVAEVIEASTQGPLVLLDAWAPWCEPCKQLTPLLERLAQESEQAWRLAKLNIDDEQALAAQLRVRSVPTVMAFKNGQLVDGFVGALPESEVLAFIDKHADAPQAKRNQEQLAEAEKLQAAGQTEEAQELFLEVLRRAPRDPAALAGLAQTYLAQDNRAEAEEVLQLIEPKHGSHTKVAAVQAQMQLGAQSADAPADLKALEAEVQAAPQDFAKRFALANAQHHNGQGAAAIASLLHILQHQPKWNEGAAHQQLLKLFAAYGPDAACVQEGRRALSKLLFR